MKNSYWSIILAMVTIGITYYFLMMTPKPDETKTEAAPETMMSPAVSQDDSTKTIDAELNETGIDNFDQDLNELDSSINQL